MKINAKGIVTVKTTVEYAVIYDKNGQVAVKNRGLAPGSKWACDIAYDIDGHLFYRVASGQYVEDTDVDFDFA